MAKPADPANDECCQQCAGYGHDEAPSNVEGSGRNPMTKRPEAIVSKTICVCVRTTWAFAMRGGSPPARPRTRVDLHRPRCLSSEGSVSPEPRTNGRARRRDVAALSSCGTRGLQLYRHRGSADQHQEVESIGPVNALDPRLDGEDQTGFPQLLVEGDLDRRQVVSVDLFKRNRTGRWFVEWQVADSGMSGCSPRRRQSWPSIGGVADTGQTSMSPGSLAVCAGRGR